MKKYKTNNPYIFVAVLTVVGGVAIAAIIHGLQRDWIAFALGALAVVLVNTVKWRGKGILD